MNRLSNLFAYLRQPMPWPTWIICVLTRHSWGAWEDVIPGSKRRRRRAVCRRCDTSKFYLPGEGVLRPTWRAVALQWLCAVRPGGHAWPQWGRMRRQTDITRGIHKMTLGRQCANCERFETTVREKRL
jgi:hypothetical protein